MLLLFLIIQCIILQQAIAGPCTTDTDNDILDLVSGFFASLCLPFDPVTCGKSLSPFVGDIEKFGQILGNFYNYGWFGLLLSPYQIQNGFVEMLQQTEISASNLAQAVKDCSPTLEDAMEAMAKELGKQLIVKSALDRFIKFYLGKVKAVYHSIDLMTAIIKHDDCRAIGNGFGNLAKDLLPVFPCYDSENYTDDYFPTQLKLHSILATTECSPLPWVSCINCCSNIYGQSCCPSSCVDLFPIGSVCCDNDNNKTACPNSITALAGISACCSAGNCHPINPNSPYNPYIKNQCCDLPDGTSPYCASSATCCPPPSVCLSDCNSPNSCASPGSTCCIGSQNGVCYPSSSCLKCNKGTWCLSNTGNSSYYCCDSSPYGYCDRQYYSQCLSCGSNGCYRAGDYCCPTASGGVCSENQVCLPCSSSCLPKGYFCCNGSPCSQQCCPTGECRSSCS